MTREKVFAAVQTLAAEEDLLAASAYVLGLGDSQAVAVAFENLILDCYHKAKSIEQVLHFAGAGVHYCLAAALAHEGTNPSAAKELRLAAKRMATNAASFTWPGWDETGVTISPEQMQQGLMYARFSVRQLHELEPTAAQLAFTYWFLGAQLMAHRQYADAQEEFAAAHGYNRAQGDDPAGRLMLEGYIGLTKLLAGDAACGESEFRTAVTALQALQDEDAQFYAEQLITARAVFVSPE